MNIDQNHLKLDSIIKGRATALLRQVFMKRWETINNGESWVNSKEYGLKFISSKGKQIYKAAKKLQKLSLESGDINKWDFTLTANVLQTIRFSLNHRKNDEMQKIITTQNKKIERLSAIRNKCAHSPTMSLTDGEFNELWDEMALILVSFGDSEEELELLKKQPIIKINETENEKEEQNEIRAMATELKQIGKNFLVMKENFQII
jgi:hypothetical protein